MQINTLLPNEQAWHLTYNIAKVKPFENSDFIRLFPTRKYFKHRISVGDKWLINDKKYTVYSVVDENEGENEFGRHYDINVVFERDDLFYRIKRLLTNVAPDLWDSGAV